jgi:hypothetical protein
MKIEIDIPELDENEWEYLGIVKVNPGYYYIRSFCDKPEIREWTDMQGSLIEYPCFRKKQSWKDKIVFPSVFREGSWIARDSKHGCRLFDRVPIYCSLYKLWEYTGACSGLTKYTFDLSFLPQEFWDCKPEDSLVQVRHEVKE